jgi:hypothetical protein
MKKKLSIFMFLILIAPIFALVGCGSSTSYEVTVRSNWTGIIDNSGGGSVTGSGTYSDGETVKLTATAATNSRFVAWVFEDAVLITGNAPYTITNQISDDNVTKSELTFKINSSRKGKYTAVFEDQKMEYTKLSSWRITSSPDSDGQEENMSTADASIQTNMYVSQGATKTTAYSKIGFFAKDNVIYHTNSVTDVLKLDADAAQDVVVTATFTKGSSVSTNIFRAEITLLESTDKSDDANYPYKVTFKDGAYDVVFEFSIGSEDYYLILTYSCLNVIY